MDRHRNPLNPTERSTGRLWWWLAMGGAALMLAGRLWLIREYGTALPFRDQWRSTAQDLLAPWLAGTLGWRDFLAPMNDHCLALTRLLSFGLVRANGQWNNLLETTVDILLLVPPIALTLRTIAPALGRGPAVAWTLFSGLLLALPITWENTLWGVQSLVFFQIALSVVYLWAVATQTRFCSAWWLGQAAGGLALLTQQSAVLAPVAAVLLLLWRLWRETDTRRNAAAGLAVAALWIALYFCLAPNFSVTADMRADSWRIALQVCLRQLAWPLPHPAWAFLMYLPWLWFASDRLLRRQLAPADAFLLALALWVGAQAAAIGTGRGGETTAFVSRYCDFLLLGVIVNAACLARLWQGAARPARIALALLGVAWLGFAAPGIRHETVASHSGHMLAHRRQTNADNIAAVRHFITTGDTSVLARDRIGETLHPYPPALISLLSDPRLRALLPPETGAPEARPDQGRLGWFARSLPAAWPLFLAAGLGLVGFAAWRLRRAPVQEPALVLEAWTLRGAALAAALAAAGGGLAWCAWPNPLTFEPHERWSAVFEPALDYVELLDLAFTRESAGPRLMPGATAGAVALNNPAPSLFWHGTLLPDLSFTATLAAQPAPLRHRYLVVPYTGWPNWNGNGLRWRFQNPATGEEQWIEYMGGNPSGEYDLWTVDAAAYRGWQATLYVFDGRTDDHGWLGVARPAATDNPAFGAQWRASLRGERAESTHRTVAAATAIAAAAALLLALLAWRRRGRPHFAETGPA
jgi:hypothetical protein